ncbi:hypothetical protein EDD16DRAFT_1703174 [Pisolithus croceorrhizus]|nr:hypothetical protein EDD16DRAFT_1703174 [Pisolithus croceorrhizus]KAI6148269.1 hypothetical protein EDD17DRAFT_1766796 [Pisolithus thermaeus]
MPLDGGSSRTTETVETETLTKETTTTMTTSSGTETVNVTVTKLCTRTTKITEITSQQPALLSSPAHVCNYSLPLSLVSRRNRASDSSPVPSVSPPSAKSSQSTPRKSRVPASKNTLQTASSVAVPTRSPRMPKYHPVRPIHPDDIELPATPINKFYIVIIGQEPGIFFNWNDAAARVLSVSKNIHFKCATFQEALQRYRDAYYSNEVKCVPNLGTHFLTQGTLDASGSSRSTPCKESASDVEYWRHVDDLSEEMSNVHVA